MKKVFNWFKVQLGSSRRYFAASLVLSGGGALSGLAEPVAMGPVDVFSFPSLRDGQLSPDGQMLLARRSVVDWGGNRFVSQLWRYEVETGEGRQLTHGANSISEPVWSPDGSQIAFLTQREDDDGAQIYLMYANGGEAFRLTELEVRPSQIQWGNEGQYLYFVAEAGLSKEEKKLVKERRVIPTFEDPRQKKQLWRVAIATEEVEALTAGEQSIIGYELGPGNEFVFVSKAPGSLLDQYHQAEIWQVPLAGGDGVRLTDNRFREGGLAITTDGKALAYGADVNERGEEYYEENVFRLDLQTGDHRELAASFGGAIEGFAWAEEREGFYFLGNTGVASHLYFCNAETGEIEALTSGDWTVKEWSYWPEQKLHLFKRQSATEPGDFWSLQVGSTEPRRVTSVNSGVQERFRLPKQELVRWQSHDGYPIEGLLTYPLDFVEGERFPLVVQTHGGPRSTDQWGIWKTGGYQPVLAAHGYGCLQVNHRGGTGYGDEFMRDMVGGYFRNAHLDVLSGVDYLVEAGLADPERLVKKGWSAGGHMTNKLITFTDRFKAASSGAGAVEWMSQFGETDASYMRAWWFGGKPWQKDAPIDNYMADSVIDELWKVKTPTLIFVGEKDVRVPATQSKILFRGLRDSGVETELYVAPGEPHGYKKPTHRLFRINKELEWFEHYVNDRSYEAQEAPR